MVGTATRREFLALQDAECPDFIWYAPPCKKWSTLQNLNLHTLEQIEALEADRDFLEATHLAMCKKSFMKQKREGRHAGLEHHRYAFSWKTRTMKSMEKDSHDSLLDQCEFNTRLPDNQGVWQLIKKPTCLRWSAYQPAQEMNRLCDGTHDHLPIEGSSPKIRNRARASGSYQRGLCEAIYDAVFRLYEDDFEQGYANEEDEEFEIELVHQPEQGEEEQPWETKFANAT